MCRIKPFEVEVEEVNSDIDVSNDFFDGWADLRLFVYNGHLAPNFTHRTPNIETMDLTKALSTKNMPDENVVGLTKLETATLKYCDRLPMFEGVIALSNLDDETCQITSLPDYRHLVSLQSFSPDTSKFYCDMQSCWGFFFRQSLTQHWILLSKISFALDRKNSREST